MNSKPVGIAYSDPDLSVGNWGVGGTAISSTAAQLNQASVIGSTLTSITPYSAALSPASVAANTTAEQIFAVAGVPVGGTVVVNKPTAQVGLGIVGARVSSAGNVAITFGNFTIGAIVPTAAETYLFLVVK